MQRVRFEIEIAGQMVSGVGVADYDAATNDVAIPVEQVVWDDDEMEARYIAAYRSENVQAYRHEMEQLGTIPSSDQEPLW